MPRRPPLRQLRGLVRDYILDHLDENPDTTEGEALPVIKDRLREDYRSSPWLEILLMLAEVLLPLLLNLRSRQ